jgi:hypothetical protein
MSPGSELYALHDGLTAVEKDIAPQNNFTILTGRIQLKIVTKQP